MQSEYMYWAKHQPSVRFSDFFSAVARMASSGLTRSKIIGGVSLYPCAGGGKRPHLIHEARS